MKQIIENRFTDLGKLYFPMVARFSKLPQLPPKILLDSEVVKIDPKILISLR